MWLFAAISLAIATPCFRSWLETLFAELSIVFFTYLRLVSIGLVFVLLLALGFHGRHFCHKRCRVDTQLQCTITAMIKHSLRAYSTPRFARVQWKRGTRRRAFLLRTKSTTREIAGSGFYPPHLWTLSLFALVMLPIITSVVVRGGGSARVRPLGTEGSPSVVDATTALMLLQQQATPCNYSHGRQCVDDVINIAVLGDYKQETGYCVAFDAAYVNTTTEGAVLTQYFPIHVQEAVAHGFRNNYSTWTKENQLHLQHTCPILYQETVQNAANELLCCTETQFERFRLHLRQIDHQSTTCMDKVPNLWCHFLCHPSNSLFLNVTQVRLMEGDADHADDVFPAIEQATYYVETDCGNRGMDSGPQATTFDNITCNTNLGRIGAYNASVVGAQVNFKTMEQRLAIDHDRRRCEDGKDRVTDCIRPVATGLQYNGSRCRSRIATDTGMDERGTFRADSPMASLSTVAVTSGDKMHFLLAEMSARFKPSPSFVVYYIAASIGAIAILFAILLGIWSRKKKQWSVSTALDIGSSIVSMTHSKSLKRISAWDAYVTRQLKRWGDFVAMGNHPQYILLVSLLLVGCASSGLLRLTVETTFFPLWVAESSPVFQERLRFRENFGPLDRMEQLVLVAQDGGAVTRSAYLKEAIRLQTIIAQEVRSEHTTLRDLCVTGASNANCQVNAITQYFQNRMDHFIVYDTYDLVQDHVRNCVKAPEKADYAVCEDLKGRWNASLPATMEDCPCLSSYGAPMTDVDQYLGGPRFAKNATANNDSLDLDQATMFFSTVLVTNGRDEKELTRAIAWERAFVSRMKVEASANALFAIYCIAETSVADEVAAAINLTWLSKAGLCMLVGLVVMVVMSLQYKHLGPGVVFDSGQFGVGFMAVACVVMGVGGTLGLFAWYGVKLQLVTLTVMPFVTLAVGLQTPFLLFDALDRTQKELKREHQSLFVDLEDNDFGIHEVTCVVLCQAMGYSGPSMVHAVMAECGIMVLACYSAMPAAQWLAGTLVLGLAATFSLQMTFFLAIIALDKRRELSGTYHHVMCCKQARSAHCRGEHGNAVVTRFVALCTKQSTKIVVLLVFGTSTIVAVLALSSMEYTLPWASFLPTQSYVHEYNRVNDYRPHDSPVYFVIEAGYGHNDATWTTLANDAVVQAKFCDSKEMCDRLSIPSILTAIQDSNVSYFSSDQVVASWVDDFWGFIDPTNECCRIEAHNGSFVPLSGDNSTENSERALVAQSCLTDASQVLSVPQKSFMSLIRMFWTTDAGPMCTFGGGTRYRHQLSIDNQPLSDAKNETITINGTTYGNDVTAFAYKIQSSTTDSQEAGRAYSQTQYLAKWISKETGIDVWVYSPESVYLDQFESIDRCIYIVFSAGLLVVFALQTLALGKYGVAVTLMTALTVLQVAALMVPMAVPLNSLAIVSLAIVATFSVHLSTHVARQFAKMRTLTNHSGVAPSGNACVQDVMMQLLTSWTLGLAVCQVVAIGTLAWVPTRVFDTYFFRTLMAGTLCSWLNGAILLPVGLSVAVDATEGRARHASAHCDEGDEDARESPATQYHRAPQ